MKILNAGWAQRIGLSSLILALSILACPATMAAEIERRIPVIGDGAGSEISVEIRREGERSAALPCLTANRETLEQLMDRISGRIGAMTAPEDGAISSSLDARPPEPDASPCSIGTLRRRAAGAKVSRTVVPESGEITIRGVKDLLQAFRAARKEKPAVAAAPPATPEERPGWGDTAPHPGR